MSQTPPGSSRSRLRLTHHQIVIPIAVVVFSLATAAAAPLPALFNLEPTFRGVEDRYGNTMAVVGDKILVGSHQENFTGGAWLFDLDTGAVAQTFQRPGVAEPGPVNVGDGFGRVVAASRQLLAIASQYPSPVNLYDRRGRWLRAIDATDLCGHVSSLAIRGGRVLVGMNCGILMTDRHGRFLRHFPDPTGTGAFEFVRHVAFLGGRTIIAATHSVSTGTDTVFALDARSGAVRWEAQAPDPTPGNAFGAGLAVVGRRLFVGAPGDDTDGLNTGAVYLLDRRTGAVRQRYANPTGRGGEVFGSAVAADRRGVLVGAPEADVDEPGAGAAYLLDARTGTLLATLTPLPNEEDAHAPRAVALTRSHLIVGGSDWSGFGTVSVYAR